MHHPRLGDATPTNDREFFDWGGWLAVRPMDELPYFRVLMRREREQPRWIEIEREHRDAIEEMRAVRVCVPGASSATGTSRCATGAASSTATEAGRTVPFALHYLWRVALAMVRGPRAGLDLLATLDTDERMAEVHRVDAVRAHLLEMAGEPGAAREAYERAAQRTTSLPEQRYLAGRAARLPVEP